MAAVTSLESMALWCSKFEGQSLSVQDRLFFAQSLLKFKTETSCLDSECTIGVTDCVPGWYIPHPLGALLYTVSVITVTLF
jgi:hypothetical protein